MKSLGTYDPDDNSYKEIKRLNTEEYQEYKKAIKRMYSINEDLSLFGAVQANYDNYIKAVDSSLPRFLSCKNIDGATMDQMVGDINLHLTNYLTTVRTFLEHSETKLKRSYGKDSQRYKNFKDATSQAYDNYFSYRFLDQLRNYIQHCGMPIAGFDGVKITYHELAKKIVFHLIVYCDKEELLKKYRWKKQVREEIQCLEPKINVTPHIQVTMNCIKDISRVVIKDDLPELIKNASYLQELMGSTEVIGTPCIYEPDNLNKKNIEWFPLHLIDVVFTLDNRFLKSAPLFEFKIPP